MSAIRVTILSVSGSAPREAGAAMLVRPDGIEGSIGGGALEWEAMRHARAMLREGAARAERRVALGPGLGQCCGGAVTLGFERGDSLPAAAGAPLWVWGAGHVGRAVVAVSAPLPGFRITWVDTGPERFPDRAPEGVNILPAPDMAAAMALAPGHAHHLILSHSHEIDLALCHAALGRGFASCGLIGSTTKWARFRSRLAALGHGADEISRISCPIGDPGLGKHPQAIAVGVAAALLNGRTPEESAAAPAIGGTVA